MRAKLEQSLDKVVLTSPAGIAWFREALHGEQIEVIRRKGRSWAVISEQIGLGWSRFTLSEIHFVNSQPKIEATPMKDQMQYIVIEGRKPQDGAKPAQALLILPKWISPTLACAGIVGRVIELTDGNVIEQGAVPMGERETLDSLREDMRLDTESQQEPTADFASSRAEALEPTHADGFHYSQQWELLNSLTGAFGCPVGSARLEWLRRELEELAQFRKVHAKLPMTSPTAYVLELESRLGAEQAKTASAEHLLERHRNAALPVQLNALLLEFGGKPGGEGYEFLRKQLEELAQFRKDRPETLARLQAAEDNLDAWRDAAGANPMIVQNTDSQTGRIVSLGVDKGANGDVMALNRQVAELQTQLQEFEGVDENFQALNEALTHRDHRIEQLRKDLKKIRKLVKAAL